MLRVYKMFDALPRKISRFDPSLDNYRRYVTDDPSPEKFAQTLRSVDDGDIAALLELQQEMEAKDADLQGVSNTRRAAITALDWEIEPDPTDRNQTQAKIVAAYCQKRLSDLSNWPKALKFMSTAIGPNLAVLELVWRSAQLADICPVPGHRLTSIGTESQGVSIETPESPMGISTSLFRNKFVVHTPEESPTPLRRTMTHATVWPYMVIHFSRTDWMSFSEKYGDPMRYATYTQAVIPEDRETINTMLANMGTDMAASFPEGVTPGLLQVAGNGETYEKQMEWAATRIQILWLGQTLTTDVGDRGSFAAAKVHDNVRTDLLLSDLESEARTIRQQILRPMVALRFPGKGFSTPIFKRQLHERKDLEASRLKMDQLEKAKELRLRVSEDQVYEALGFDKPEDGDQSAIQLGRTATEDTNDEL